MIQHDIKTETFKQINKLLDLMDKLNEIEMDCKQYINSADNNQLNTSFQNIRETIALNHYYHINRLHIFKDTE